MSLYIKAGKYLLAFSLLGGLASCNIDDVKPYYQLYPENVVRDGASAQNALNGVYSLGRTFDLGFYPLHLAVYGTEGVVVNGFSGSTGFYTNDVRTDNDFLGNLYNANYKVIDQANFLIQELEAGKAVGLGDERKNGMIAEAKFQRAFAYFNILRFFGEYYDLNSSYGVVIRTKFATTVELDPRSTVKQVYDLIISDLKFGSEFGPEFIDHFYAGKIASKALLSKVYLYTGQYPESAALAEEVINNYEGYELEANYNSIFSNKYYSSEVIFAPFAGSTSERGSSMEIVKSTNYSEYLYNLAEDQVDGVASLAGAGTNIDPRFAFAYSDSSKGINNQGKYPHQATAGTQKNTMYHLRLAEIYLVYAEALVRSGDDENLALDQVNILRDRAGVDSKVYVDKATLLDDIRKEKELELFFENGEPLFDLVRYGIIDNFDITSEKATLNQKFKYILPIPQKVLAGNNKVVPNPGY